MQTPELEDSRIEELSGLSDTEILQHTRKLKLKMIAKLAPDENMPIDAKEVNALLSVIDSIDRVAGNNIKIQSDSDSNQAQRDAMVIIAQMQKQTRGKDPFMLETVTETRVVSIEEVLVTDKFAPGELTNESRDLTYDDFVNEYENNQ